VDKSGFYAVTVLGMHSLNRNGEALFCSLHRGKRFPVWRVATRARHVPSMWPPSPPLLAPKSLLAPKILSASPGET
jgi:hypothetical protein